MSKDDFERYIEAYLTAPEDLEDERKTLESINYPINVPISEGYPHILQEAYAQSPVPESINLTNVTKVIYIYP